MTSLRTYISRIEARLARQRTQDLLRQLPAHLQSDVGYPELFNGRR